MQMDQQLDDTSSDAVFLYRFSNTINSTEQIVFHKFLLAFPVLSTVFAINFLFCSDVSCFQLEWTNLLSYLLLIFELELTFTITFIVN